MSRKTRSSMKYWCRAGRAQCAVVLGLTGLTASMQGCIAGEIRDSLAEVNESLARTNASLDLVISSLDLRLTRLEPIEESLLSIDAQLYGIDESLDHLDNHLASLRRTLQNIDSTIPFLKLSDDEEVEGEEGDEAPSAGSDEEEVASAERPNPN